MAELWTNVLEEGTVQIKRQISFNNNKSYKSFAWSAEDKAKSFQKDNDDMLQRGDNNNLLQTHTHVCGLEIFFHPARMSLFLRPVFPFIPLPAPIEPNPAAKVLAT